MTIPPPRRKDRTITDDAWIAAFLQRAPVITLAFAQEDQPFIKPTLFVYDPQRHAIYFHATPFGHTAHILAQYPKASLTAFHMGRLLPASRAMDFSVEYESVVAYGQVSIVTEAEEAIDGLQRLLDKYFPHLQPEQDYAPIDPQDLQITAVFRFDIQHWVGKRKSVPDDYPNAFHYPITHHD